MPFSFYCIAMFCVFMDTCALMCYGDQRITYRHQFSPLTAWVSGIKPIVSILTSLGFYVFSFFVLSGEAVWGRVSPVCSSGCPGSSLCKGSWPPTHRNPPSSPSCVCSVLLRQFLYVSQSLDSQSRLSLRPWKTQSFACLYLPSSEIKEWATIPKTILMYF